MFRYPGDDGGRDDLQGGHVVKEVLLIHLGQVAMRDVDLQYSEKIAILCAITNIKSVFCSTRDFQRQILDEWIHCHRPITIWPIVSPGHLISPNLVSL